MLRLSKTATLNLFRSNNEIVNFYKDNIQYETANKKREQIKIAAIDDEPFAPQTNLKNYGYNIEPVGDIKRVQEIADYHIILCDIMGVGRHFDHTLQGASLISEIKRTFPGKVVIAYTGAMLNQTAAREARTRADDTLKKDVDIESWISTLDKYSEEVMNPHTVWNKIRKNLVEIDIDTKSILVLEDAYVRSVLKKDSSFGDLVDALKILNLDQDVRGIIQGLAASVLFKVMFGA